MKTLFKLMLSAVLLTGFSCSTDDASIDQTNIQNVMVSSKARTSSNPFDYLGVLHNNFMTDMHNSKPSYDEIPDLTLKFVEKNGYDTSKFDTNAIAEVMNEAMSSEFTKEKIDELGKRFRYSDEYKGELYKLADFFNSDSYENTDDIVNQLKEIETSYLQADKLSEEEQHQLLAIIAITRHSADYWISFYSKDANKQNNAITSNRTRWWARIFGGILSDAMGAVIGLAGGPVGALVTGVAASVGVQFGVDDNL